MNKFKVRILIVFLVWFAFTVLSTAIYVAYIHDVGGTYMAMGFFSFPLIAVFVWCLDYYIKLVPVLKNRFGLITAIDSMFAIALYYPGAAVFWRVIYPYVLA